MKKKKEENKVIKNFKNNLGITLIALVITIIVLLILAGVSIAMLTGENGIITQATEAKIQTAVGTVKEQIKLYQAEERIKERKLTPETLLAMEKVSRIVQKGEEEKYYMYYTLKDNAFEEMQGLGKGNIADLKDVFLIDDSLNVKYIASNGKEYGDNINKKILDDETEIRFSSKAFSEYISMISGVTEEEMKFKWIKNQTELTIASSEIDNLQDLVFFSNLKKLTLGDYKGNVPEIKSMDGVENCLNLVELHIIYCQDIDYSAISNLKKLTTVERIAGNDYKSIAKALEKSNSIEKMIINQQNITDTSVFSSLVTLKDLRLLNSKITKIQGLNNLTELETLYLPHNKITKIENIENLKKLKILNLENNDIEDIIPASSNTTLNYLNLKGNSRIDGNRNNYKDERLEKLNNIGKILDNGGTIKLDIDKIGLFKNYSKLDLSNQNISSLEILEGMTGIKDLNLSSNNLTLEDQKSQEILKSMKDLEVLNLNSNPLKTISSINELSNLKNLSILGKTKLNLLEIQDIISNLTSLKLSTESLETIINCDANKIRILNLGYNDNIKSIPDLTKFSELKVLNLTNNPNISNFNEISKLTSLKLLYLGSNNLHGKMIDFSNLTNLTKVDLSGNTLWSEDLENLKALKNDTNLTINLSNNSIIDATALLELSENTKINLTKNLNLTKESKEKLEAKFKNNVTF